MQSTTTRKKETMRTIATQKLVRIAALLAPAAALAASAGNMHWSDETLKQQIQPLDSPLARLSQL
jgi:hypothetical protein